MKPLDHIIPSGSALVSVHTRLPVTRYCVQVRRAPRDTRDDCPRRPPKKRNQAPGQAAIRLHPPPARLPVPDDSGAQLPPRPAGRRKHLSHDSRRPLPAAGPRPRALPTCHAPSSSGPPQDPAGAEANPGRWCRHPCQGRMDCCVGGDTGWGEGEALPLTV
jgi:hypothetical protein